MYLANTIINARRCTCGMRWNRNWPDGIQCGFQPEGAEGAARSVARLRPL